MTTSYSGVRPYGFAGPVEYIERITDHIWNLPRRDLSLIRSYYNSQTAIHLDAGDLVGDAAVVANTERRLRSFPDFHGIIDDTIWTGSEDRGYRTSMRWTWSGTDTGGTAFGPATGRRVTFMAIANCVIQGQVIVEEWLGANPLSQARQLGYDLDAAAQATLYPEAHRVPLPSFTFAPTAEGDLVYRAFTSGLNGRLATDLYSDQCHSTFSADRQATGIPAIEAWTAELREALGPVDIHLDDQYGLPASGQQRQRTASQWRLSGSGPRGPVEIGLISHHHLLEGRVTAQWLAYDELALAHHGITLPPIPA